VNYEFPPQGGGAGVVMLDLAVALRTSQPQLHQTILSGWDFSLGPSPALPGIDLKLIPVTRNNIHHTGTLAMGQFLWRGARAFRSVDPSTYEIVHFHFSVPTGILAPLSRGKPYVCSLHGIDVPHFVSEAALFQTLVAPINRRILSGAARLFAPSRHIAETVLRACPAAAVEIIPHGVAASSFHKKTSYPKFARRFVTIARLLPWKRVGNVIEAIVDLHKTIPDVTLTIFGEGDLRSSLEDLISASRAEAYVSLNGFVSKERLQATLCTYDAFVLPSISEAFGLVFLEAMAAGLPVVAFDFGGPTDIITPGVDGLLIKRDAVEDLVQVLGDLATTPNQAAELGNGAWRAATQRFSWTAISKRYFSAYESVLAERGVRAS